MKKFLTAIIFLISIILVSNSTEAVERSESDFIGASYKSRVVNCEEWISLRREPSVDSERLAKIPLGTIVVTYDGSVEGINDFYPVEYNGIQGYCLRFYLKYESDAGAPVNR